MTEAITRPMEPNAPYAITTEGHAALTHPPTRLRVMTLVCAVEDWQITHGMPARLPELAGTLNLGTPRIMELARQAVSLGLLVEVRVNGGDHRGYRVPTPDGTCPSCGAPR